MQAVPAVYAKRVLLSLVEEVQIGGRVEIVMEHGVVLRCTRAAVNDLLHVVVVREPRIGEVLESNLNGLVRVFCAQDIDVDFVVEDVVVHASRHLGVDLIRVWLLVDRVERHLTCKRCYPIKNLHSQEKIL